MLEQVLAILLRDSGAACVGRALANGVVQADFLHVGPEQGGSARVGVLFLARSRTKLGHTVSSRGARPLASPGLPRNRCLPICWSCPCERVARVPSCLVLKLLDIAMSSSEHLYVVNC
jgi:hypothetical protein